MGCRTTLDVVKFDHDAALKFLSLFNSAERMAELLSSTRLSKVREMKNLLAGTANPFEVLGREAVFR